MNTFDPYFTGIFTVADRMQMFNEVEREADLDALRGEATKLARRVDRSRALGVLLNAAAASLREKGEIDWRAACAALIVEPDQDTDTTAEALERMVRAYAEPGAAAKGGRATE